MREAVPMVIAKWGNSLAVRIPSDLVEELHLKPGEKVRIARSGEHGFVVERDRSREEAMEKLRSLRFTVPDDYVFNRDEIYDQ
jgi:antitoxin MazE